MSVRECRCLLTTVIEQRVEQQLHLHRSKLFERDVAERDHSPVDLRRRPDWRKVGKDAARKAFVKRVKSEADWERQPYTPQQCMFTRSQLLSPRPSTAQWPLRRLSISNCHPGAPVGSPMLLGMPSSCGPGECEAPEEPVLDSAA